MKEKLAALPRRAPEPVDPPGVTVSREHLRALDLMGWGAYLALMWFLWQKVLQVSQQQYETMSLTHIAFWIVDLQVYFPLLIGYAFVALTVPYAAKHGIPTLVKLSWREHFWPKVATLSLVVLVSGVLISGTATVGGHAVLESERDAAVAVEQTQHSRAALQAQINSIDTRLAGMRDQERVGTYAAIAASVGAAAYDSEYLSVEALARTDPSRRDLVRRARGAAVAADALERQKSELEAQLASTATIAAVSSEVRTERTETLNAVMGFLNTFWILLLAFVMDAICLLVPWIRETLRLKRIRELAMAEPREFDAAHAIEDLRAEPSVVAQPMEPAKEVVKDGETGEVYEKIKPKEYWRKKKGKPQTVRIDGERLPDETGVQYDGDARVAMAAAGAVIVPSMAASADPGEQPTSSEASAEEQHGTEDNDNVHASDATTLPLSDEAIDALNDDFAPEEEARIADDAHTLPNGEGVIVPPEREPEMYGPPAPARRELEGVG